MKKLMINCRSGMSGDMMLGAMLSLGVPLATLEEGLASLGLNEFDLSVHNKEYHGSPVTDVDVILHNREHAWIHPYSGKFRNYAQIKEMIAASTISENAKSLARRIFDIKAEAESIAHGVPVDQVQFHEVGAVDSIVDVVGAAICVDHTGAQTIVSRYAPTGFGTVECACGTLPVPAPAVQAVIDNTALPHYRGDVEQELMTPTGASILAGTVDEFLPEEAFDQAWEDTLAKAGESSAHCIGRGSGKRDTGLGPLMIMLTDI